MGPTEGTSGTWVGTGRKLVKHKNQIVSHLSWEFLESWMTYSVLLFFCVSHDTLVVSTSIQTLLPLDPVGDRGCPLPRFY